MEGDGKGRRLTRLSEVRSLADAHGIHPSRALGQNFLIDGNVLDILITAADIHPGDRVLEVGPGMGVVTEDLLGCGALVTAIEKDHRLAALLRETFATEPRLRLIEGDALDQSVALLREHGLTKLVSNLPYNPGSRILLDVICTDCAPLSITVTVQLEVAERLTARPGCKAYGLLGVWSQLHYEVKTVKVISPSCFWPRPTIRSAIVTLHRRPEPLLAPPVFAGFYGLTRHCFQHRRKQLVALLAKAPEALRIPADDSMGLLQRLGIDAEARPENLTVEAWCMFAQRLHDLQEVPA